MNSDNPTAESELTRYYERLTAWCRTSKVPGVFYAWETGGVAGLEKYLASVEPKVIAPDDGNELLPAPPVTNVNLDELTR